MRRTSILIALVLMLAALGFSQEYTPKVEVGLGYSYSRANVPNSVSRVNMNGLLINTVINMNRWLGAEAEFGTHYHCISGCWIDNIRVDNPDARNDSLSFLAGPKLTLNRQHRMSPWVHSLFGVTKISYLNTITDTRMSNTGFGMALGGGLDVNLSKLTVRAAQVDYTRFAGNPSPSNNVRIGGGIVLRIGHLTK
jgi:opacity protein-like surface antigen